MPVIKLEKLFYNNKWNKPVSKKVYKNNNPINLRVLLSNSNKKDVENCVYSALGAEKKFKNFSNLKKSEIFKKISEKIIINANELAQRESNELGKDFNSAKKEIIACAKLWKHASIIVKKKNFKLIKKNKIKLYEFREPVGIVALILPWNFPMIVMSERLPYILAAGNSVLIKPSENGCLSIDYFIRMIVNLGLPKGVINYLTGDITTGKHIVNNKNISMISFTGSTEVGKEIYSKASKTIKRLSLELGGKNPMIVFIDANLKLASKDVIYSFIHNAGQCCVSGSKLFIEEKIAKKFLDIIKISLDKIHIFQNTTTTKQYNKIKKIILKALKNKIPTIYKKKKLFDDEKRIIYPIIFQPRKKVDYLEKEIFGPILLVRKFKKKKELIKFINDTNYGLSALIWTKNKRKAMEIASNINFGRIWINGNISQNYPELSIGGYKESGMNRETGDSGIKTYSEIKSIIVN
jgi:acyl-CoA reductase-like NAD-dependent aldehyde dehydrogenase